MASSSQPGQAHPQATIARLGSPLRQQLGNYLTVGAGNYVIVHNGTFSIACIPFRTYGLALGDRVVLSDDDEVAEVVALSWHRVLRLLFVPGLAPTQLAQAVDRIKNGISTAGLLNEWSGDRRVAVDIPPNTDASRLFEIMEHEVTEGRAFWEWADAMPFSARR
ncbi:DUF4265 domain-containing protein [Kitasatospora sp. NPDC057692]|uniref:DUF4265 domain-containing protein n=1 Tax=Kitasatospora sp. NPDC057692 TaxID=3346215 RepID=UPI00369E96B4